MNTNTSDVEPQWSIANRLVAGPPAPLLHLPTDNPRTAAGFFHVTPSFLSLIEPTIGRWSSLSGTEICDMAFKEAPPDAAEEAIGCQWLAPAGLIEVSLADEIAEWMRYKLTDILGPNYGLEPCTSEKLICRPENPNQVAEYDTVLFDSDGILVDPPAYETKVEAARAAFAEVGVTQVKHQHIDDIVNGTTVERLQEICAAYGLDVDTFWEARERLDEASQFGKFESGSRTRYDDVSALSDISQACGVVSNNHHSTIEFVIDFFDLQSTFDTYYGREKTVESLDLKKPNTHYLDLALSELGAESALYVGDSENDVRAAHEAGIDSVFVRRPHCTDVNLSTTPTYDTNNLHEVTKIVG